ncbi:OLC1v1033566C1 [Oldenlandia corymbosa var. corymbosa]|uniref:OLC1v1033566C1 n=1 Tax=Oldenlandia corymbosa var. corymbosa TaxID=529605 RepID=A0AAV1CPZ1_OLDCO|nr:OLC1v1033566C1 [Oldenlandia corymbosa var. corymbosa]
MRGLDYSLFDVDDELEIGDDDVILTKDGGKARIEISDRLEQQLVDQWKDICKENMYRVLNNDPWVILNTYLYVQPWDSSFNAATSRVKATIVWARLLGLPVHHYNQSFLKKIGRALGKVKHIDQQTATKTWGRFARMAVKIELDEPLVTEVDMREGDSPSIPIEIGENPTDKAKGKRTATTPSPSVLGTRKSSSRGKIMKNHEWKMLDVPEPEVNVATQNKTRPNGPSDKTIAKNNEVLMVDTMNSNLIDDDIPPDLAGGILTSVVESMVLEGQEPSEEDCLMEDEAAVNAVAISDN